MMSQINLYSSSNVEKSPHEITMSAIAARLRDVHAKMRRKEPPLPYTESPVYAQTQAFIEGYEAEKTAFDEKANTLINARLDEISHAILFDYQDRQKKENITFNALSSIIARLDEEQSNETTVTVTPETPLSSLVLDAFYEQLEERFFKRQQIALDKLSTKIEQLSRDLREATAASRHNGQIIALESTIHEVHNLLKTQKLHKQPLEKEQKNSHQNIVETSFQSSFQTIVKDTHSGMTDSTLETLLNVATETKADINADENIDLVANTDGVALSTLLKNIPVQSIAQKQTAQSPADQTMAQTKEQEGTVEISPILQTSLAKPFDIHASARLIAAARKNR